ncbi:MAG: hypothetical protein LC108_08290 [Anaerolineales bacterium]|nr:hypothetical protein [Anaerolineales bacterium]
MNEITTTNKVDAAIMESVLLGGDLSKLTPEQRVSYYRHVCESVGLNPLTKPFDYMNLNGKLTLYAKKDATDQLRKINNVSIDDVDIVENETQFLVKVKGHDATGRTDVEIGVVKKTDMQGNLGNVQMKAVTKAKRRLTLSLCGLGWLDETEVETIRDAKLVNVQADTGEIVDAENPNPVTDQLWTHWLSLCARADKVNVKHANPDRAKVIADDLIAEGKELRRYVEAAERQAAAESGSQDS